MRLACVPQVEPEVRKLYLATAGAPGAGKSHILEQVLASGGDARFGAVVKVDPDRYVMRDMSSYQFAVRNSVAPPSRAYEDARPGSNSIATSE
ncbi:hypothetical protein DID99_36470 [Burkholderia sp. Bp8986]|nr:hypothetical protein DID99_36470 [Burkholderia sp. Bp8986]